MSTDQLLGKWVSDPDDPIGYAKYGDVSLEFLADGQLIYTMNDPHRTSTMVMEYRVEGEEIVTTQRSNPREERTTFSIDADGKLSLSFGGIETRYVRGSEGDTH